MDKLFRFLFIAAFAALISTNPWFNLADVASIPGWKQLSNSEKLEKCVAWEKEAAEDLGVEYLPDVVIGTVTESTSTITGTYQPWDNTIVLYLENMDDMFLAYSTVCHETRHAYQNQEVYKDSEIGQTFADSFLNYVSYSSDENGYREQFVEVDARKYASSMVRSNWIYLLIPKK